MGLTPHFSIPWPEPDDEADIPQYMGEQAQRVDEVLADSVEIIAGAGWGISGEIMLPSGLGNVIPGVFVPVGPKSKITPVKLRAVVGSGGGTSSVTLSLKVNASTIASGLVVTNTPADFALTAAQLADGDLLAPVVTAVSSGGLNFPVNLSLTVYLKREVIP